MRPTAKSATFTTNIAAYSPSAGSSAIALKINNPVPNAIQTSTNALQPALTVSLLDGAHNVVVTSVDVVTVRLSPAALAAGVILKRRTAPQAVAGVARFGGMVANDPQGW